MTSWVMIALGGAAGSVLRYAVQCGMQRALGGSFPAGTMLVNVAGCLAIGAMAAAAGPLAMREEHRLAIMTGLLGGFTTFSAFGLETLQLAASGEARLAATNVVLSVGLGLAAVWGGYRGQLGVGRSLPLQRLDCHVVKLLLLAPSGSLLLMSGRNSTGVPGG